jgi:drug/metabolite transporter (DMT)-like permease
MPARTTSIEHGAGVPAWLARLLCFAAAVVWGTSFFIMKDTVDVIPPNFLIAVRFTVAALVLAVALNRRILAHLNRATVLGGLGIGVIYFAGYCAQTVGLTDTTPGKNAFLTGVYCVLVPFFMWFVTKKRPTAYNVVAAVLCVAGIGLVSLSGDLSIRTGDLLTLLCAVLFAVHIVANARVSQGTDVLVLTMWQFASAAVCAWVASALFEEPPALEAWTPQVVATMAYLALVCSLLALIFQNIGTKYADPSSASLLLSLESPLGVFFSVVFAGEVLTAQVVAGFVLIFAAIVTSETRWSFLRPSTRA